MLILSSNIGIQKVARNHIFVPRTSKLDTMLQIKSLFKELGFNDIFLSLTRKRVLSNDTQFQEFVSEHNILFLILKEIIDGKSHDFPINFSDLFISPSNPDASVNHNASLIA